MYMFNNISIDIVEMVIVASDNYNLFEVLQQMLLKLNDPSRITRINDKLTKVLIDHNGINYNLNGNLHREYNKPSFVSIKLLNDKYDSGIYYYCNYGINLRKNGLSSIGVVYRTGYDSDSKRHKYIAMVFEERATFVGVKESMRYFDYETIISYYIR